MSRDFLQAVARGIEYAKGIYEQHRNEIDINGTDENQDNNTALITASITEQHELLCWLLTLPGIDVNQTNKNNQTALYWACYKGNEEITKTLLTHGANANTLTAIRAVLMLGNEHLLPLLLKHGLDLNAKNYRQDTLLITAVRNGVQETVMVLLNYGVDIHVKDKHGRTALCLACLEKNDKVIQLLLEHDASKSINSQDCEGNTAVSLAARLQRDSAVAMLIEYGADLCLKNADGKNALDFLLENKSQYYQELFGEYARDGLLEKAQRLLSEMKELIDVNHAGGSDKQTPLARAARYGQTEMVAWLLEETNANVNTRSRNGHTPLLDATNSGHYKVASLLLGHGAGANDCDKHGWTALMRASTPFSHPTARSCDGPNERQQLVEALLKHGARLDAQNAEGRTALHLAVHAGLEDIVRLLLEHGACPSGRDCYGNTILISASAHKNQITQILLAHGAESSVNETDNDKKTALFWAVCNGNDDVVACLLSHGANPDLRDAEGHSALMVASRKRSIEFKLLNILIDYGASLYTRDCHGRTALQAAPKVGQAIGRIKALVLGETLWIPWTQMSMLP